MLTDDSMCSPMVTPSIIEPAWTAQSAIRGLSVSRGASPQAPIAPVASETGTSARSGSLQGPPGTATIPRLSANFYKRAQERAQKLAAQPIVPMHCIPKPADAIPACDSAALALISLAAPIGTGATHAESPTAQSTTVEIPLVLDNTVVLGS